MRRKITVWNFISMLMLLGLLKPASGGEIIHIRYATANPPGSAHVVFAEKFKERVERYSKGKLNIELHFDGKLGSEQDNVMDVSAGSIHMCTASVNNVVPFAPVLGFTTLPYIFPKMEQARKLFVHPVMDEINQEMEKTANIRALSWIILGYRAIHNTKKRIRSPDDLKGLKIRVPETALMVDIYRAWGIEPIPLAWTQMYDALKSGLVHGGDNPPNVIKSSRFYTVEKHLTMLHYNLSIAPLLVNPDFFQLLSRNEQDIIKKSAREASEYEWDWIERENIRNLKWLISRGMILSKPLDREKEWIERARTVWPRYYPKIGGREFVDKITGIIEGK